VAISVRPARQRDGRLWFNEAGKPTRTRDGIASWQARFDGRGNQIELAYFDEVGNPIEAKSSSGAVVVHLKYDERDDRVETALYNRSGKLIGRQHL
jgi:hypothetical protein